MSVVDKVLTAPRWTGVARALPTYLRPLPDARAGQGVERLGLEVPGHWQDLKTYPLQSPDDYLYPSS